MPHKLYPTARMDHPQIKNEGLKSIVLRHAGYYMTGGSFLILAQATQVFFDLIRVYVFTNHADKTLYGGYSYVLATISILVAVTQPGVNNAITYAAAKDCDGSLVVGTKKRFRYVYLGSIFLVLVAFAIRSMPEGSYLFRPFLLSSIFFPFLHTTTGYIAFLHGKKDFKHFSIFQILSSFTITVSIVLAILSNGDLSTVVLAFLLSTTLANFFCWKLVKKDISNNSLPDNFEKMANNLSGLAILGIINNQIDRLIVGTFIDLKSLALYNFSRAFADPLRQIGVMVNKLTYPQFAKSHKEQALRNIRKILPLIFLFTIILVLLIWFLAPFIIAFLFPKYMVALPFVRVLALATVLTIPGLLLIGFYFSHSSLHAIYYKMHIWSYILSIPFLLAAGYWFGVNGIVFFRLLASIGNTVANFTVFYWLKSKARGPRTPHDLGQTA